MIGYAIASLKKNGKIVGIRVLKCDDYTYKDIDINSALFLKSKSSDMLYNMSAVNKENILKLPILDLNSHSLNKDIYTILLNNGKQYLISNAFGSVFTLDEIEVKKLVFNNADSNLSGSYEKMDESTEWYERSLMFTAPVSIEDGELMVSDELPEDLVLPYIVTSIGKGCWLKAGKLNSLYLSPNLKTINQGDLDELYVDTLIVPFGVKRLNAFAFSNCHARRVVIQGNTVASIGAFNNSFIDEVYVNNALINKYRTVVKSGIKLIDLSKFSG